MSEPAGKNDPYSIENIDDPTKIDAALRDASFIFAHSELGTVELSLEVAEKLIRRTRLPVMATVAYKTTDGGAITVILQRDHFREANEDAHRHEPPLR